MGWDQIVEASEVNLLVEVWGFVAKFGQYGCLRLKQSLGLVGDEVEEPDDRGAVHGLAIPCNAVQEVDERGEPNLVEDDDQGWGERDDIAHSHQEHRIHSCHRGPTEHIAHCSIRILPPGSIQRNTIEEHLLPRAPEGGPPSG